MFSRNQQRRIEEIFKKEREFCIERVVLIGHFSSRKTYYSHLHSNNPETVIKLAIISHIAPNIIINQLFPALNYTLNDSNPRNQIILDGIKKRQTIENINARLKEAKETEF